MKNLFLYLPSIFLVFSIVFTSTFPIPVQAQIYCPNVSGGEVVARPGTFTEVVCVFLNLFDIAIPIIIAGTLLVFLWGLAKFILASGDEKKIEDGKMLITWGLVGLFVMVSIWGIIGFFYSDIIADSPSGRPLLPILPTGGGE